MRNDDPFDHRNQFKEMRKEANGMFKSFGAWALLALLANAVFILGLVAGVCWIVKHFFFQ